MLCRRSISSWARSSETWVAFARWAFLVAAPSTPKVAAAPIISTTAATRTSIIVSPDSASPKRLFNQVLISVQIALDAQAGAVGDGQLAFAFGVFDMQGDADVARFRNARFVVEDTAAVEVGDEWNRRAAAAGDFGRRLGAGAGGRRAGVGDAAFDRRRTRVFLHAAATGFVPHPRLEFDLGPRRAGIDDDAVAELPGHPLEHVTRRRDFLALLAQLWLLADRADQHRTGGAYQDHAHRPGDEQLDQGQASFIFKAQAAAHQRTTLNLRLLGLGCDTPAPL